MDPHYKTKPDYLDTLPEGFDPDLENTAQDLLVRLELLGGFLADNLYPAKQLPKEMKLRSAGWIDEQSIVGKKRSHSIKSNVCFLCEMEGSIWKRLGIMVEEIQALSKIVREAGKPLQEKIAVAIEREHQERQRSSD
jgi:hypothetical protein